jgi:hypothetical protein
VNITNDPAGPKPQTIWLATLLHATDDFFALKVHP